MVLPLGSLGWSSSFQAEEVAIAEIFEMQSNNKLKADLRKVKVGVKEEAGFKKRRFCNMGPSIGPLVFHVNIKFLLVPNIRFPSFSL